ncbi:MAG: leucyl aminopeptidase, partial [Rubrivivax sp.]|nr:leucyl aminopeptidase [Rubrivivax sp.]
MDFELQSLRLADAAARKSPALMVLVADGFAGGEDALSALIARTVASGDFKTEAGAQLFVYGAAGIVPERVVLAGIGDGSPARVRKAVGTAMGALRGGPAKAVTLCFAQPAEADALRAAVLALADASYTYSATKSKPNDKKEPPRIGKAVLGVPEPGPLREALQQAVAVARGVELAREWANRPGNHATPTLLADAARQLGKLPRIGCEVLGPKEVARLGMGAFQAVAQGSRQELRFIVLRYDGAPRSQAPVVLVGKGITFDTGGISIKPAPEMDEM